MSGAEVGKSHLIKIIYMSLSKVLIYKGSELYKPRNLLLAPTGVAAINTNGIINNSFRFRNKCWKQVISIK